MFNGGGGVNFIEKSDKKISFGEEGERLYAEQFCACVCGGAGYMYVNIFLFLSS